LTEVIYMINRNITTPQGWRMEEAQKRLKPRWAERASRQDGQDNRSS
jgi:hypothetical protein